MVALAGTAAGTSNGRLAELLAPVFLSGDLAGAARGWAWLGPVALVAGAAGGAGDAAARLSVGHELAGAAAGGSGAAGALSLAHALAGAAAGASGGALAFLGVPLELDGRAAGGSAAALARLNLGLALAGQAVGSAAAEAHFAFAMPAPRPPRGDEGPGTVNLVRNPSLEAGELLDWSATGDVLGVVNDPALAWAGEWFAALDAAADAAATLAVASQAGLGLSGGLWVGSLFVAGIGSGEARLRADYADGSSAEGDPWPWAAPASGWARLVTAPLAADPGKELDRLALVVAVAADPAGSALRCDGAQIEPDAGLRATPYADGEQGAGHRWTGAPRRSPSVRETGA